MAMRWERSERSQPLNLDNAIALQEALKAKKITMLLLRFYQ
ncbi:MAG: hypothetical protein AAFQ14_08555 [Cyanobacteria bacterium J06621_12]